MRRRSHGANDPLPPGQHLPDHHQLVLRVCLPKKMRSEPRICFPRGSLHMFMSVSISPHFLSIPNGLSAGNIFSRIVTRLTRKYYNQRDHHLRTRRPDETILCGKVRTGSGSATHFAPRTTHACDSTSQPCVRFLPPPPRQHHLYRVDALNSDSTRIHPPRAPNTCTIANRSVVPA